MLIAFLGDSLTEGWPGAAYFPLLDRRMTQHGLLNRGRAGDTVSDLLARMRHEGLEPVDAAFIWAGANDAVIGAWDGSGPGSGWSWPERLMRLAGDYEELLEWTEARAPRIVVVRPIVLETEGPLWQDRAADVAEAIARIAASRETCRVLDLKPAFAAAAEEGEGPFTTDGVHFTDAGAEVVATAFAGVIAELEVEDETSAQTGPSGDDRLKRLHKLALAAIALEALGAAYSFVVLPRLRRWGATAEEISRPLPGDDLLADPLYATTRAVTVQAPAEAVFPWLVQIGQNRGGFYTYDLLENLARLDIHSADRIHPEWQDLETGATT